MMENSLICSILVFRLWMSEMIVTVATPHNWKQTTRPISWFLCAGHPSLQALYICRWRGLVCVVIQYLFPLIECMFHLCWMIYTLTLSDMCTQFAYYDFYETFMLPNWAEESFGRVFGRLFSRHVPILGDNVVSSSYVFWVWLQLGVAKMWADALVTSH